MRNNDILALDRRYRHLFSAVLIELHELDQPFAIFETYRDADEQARQFAEGDTKAKFGGSPHNFGLAADYVPLSGASGWYWPEPDWHGWEILQMVANRHGLDNRSASTCPSMSAPQTAFHHARERPIAAFWSFYMHRIRGMV